MKRIYKIMRDKKGEGYIDAAVVVFCVMFVIALGVRMFPVFITKIQLDNFADELVREAEISGRVGSETTARQNLGGKNRDTSSRKLVKNRKNPVE